MLIQTMAHPEMTMSSNEKRSFWRKKCRAALADHISQRLGLEIPPDKIRLQPGPEDLYNWTVTGSAKQLFASNISSGSVRTLQQICAALERGDLIEAVHRERLQESSPHKDHPNGEPNKTGFTATIEQLKRENEELTLKYERYKRDKDQEIMNLQKKNSEEHEQLRTEVDRWKAGVEKNLNKQVTTAVEVIQKQLATLSEIAIESFKPRA